MSFSRRASAGGVHENPECVSETFKHSRTKDLVVRQREQTLSQSKQMARKVAAVNGRNVFR